MRFSRLGALAVLAAAAVADVLSGQAPLLRLASSDRTVSSALFSELEELARIVDITYCVTFGGGGITKPFTCLSRCSDFAAFELVKTWNTGPLLSDSCGYIALDHGKRRVIVAFRGTYSIANTVVDLSTVPQKYVPYPGDDAAASGSLGGPRQIRRDVRAQSRMYEGCFSSSQPLTKQGTFVFQSVGYCQARCKAQNASVSGLSEGNACWCGNELPAASSKVDDANCDTPCAGYAPENCGGDGYWSVYTRQNDDGKRDSWTGGTATHCQDCTVHFGFFTSWQVTRNEILQALQEQLYFYPHYDLNLVGHSLGGAVAALAALDLEVRGWNPVVTTFGEPRIGNSKLAEYLDTRFNLTSSRAVDGQEMDLRYRRVTHIDDPVPLLPLGQWGYHAHAGEIFISRFNLSPGVQDVQHCSGENDPDCIAGQDSSTDARRSSGERQRDLLSSVRDEVHDVINEPWGIPSRYKLWQLFFAHRDYFWRLGLCVPGGDPLGGGR